MAKERTGLFARVFGQRDRDAQGAPEKAQADPQQIINDNRERGIPAGGGHHVNDVVLRMVRKA